ncbi:merozoite surface protein 3b [Pseudomonas chlororaphis]|uniref:merozoite surface protein 3b n=1 Tax=Pseudomonas chlororaphis TaxID=587753 RepID=UPI000F556C50|nr:merozoite surface protein 3b [Pseudomonas chlororaphis]AZD46972.1 putative merozoite surface protein 3b [Pseudomonas chlororaphis subsp. aurantiaca]MBP5074423.1 merozoite surface protein 3b [Pseudomonas chlororaphis]
MNYLERSMSALRSVGINFPTQDAPVLALLDKVSVYDANRVTNIAATLQQSTVFNASVRDKLQSMDISTRYADIAASFDSIQADAQQMMEWMADGKLQFSERIQLAWLNMRRGSIPDRFEDIRKNYLAVAKSANEQIQLETLILEAYQDYRLAMKTAEVDACEVQKVAQAQLDAGRKTLADAGTALEVAELEAAERVKLELARDVALRNLQDEDKRYQIITDIADQLKAGYNAAELVFARLSQYHSVKERLYQRAVSFFATNEIVLTGLAAGFTSSGGLAEVTQTLNAMNDGINSSLEAQAKVGGEQLEAALKAGYGTNLKVSSVKALAEAVVDFQASSLSLIQELRKESASAAAEIESITEDSKRRFSALLQKGL